MTKRDFFRIIIKLFALYSMVLTVFNLIPVNISYLVFDFSLLQLISILGITLLALLFFLLLVRKADKIIDILNIDEGFDDPNIVIGNLEAQKILMLGIILISGPLLIYNLSEFVQFSFYEFKNKIEAGNGLNQALDTFGGSRVNYFQWVISGANIIIGYLLLANNKYIAIWLDNKVINKDEMES